MRYGKFMTAGALSIGVAAAAVIAAPTTAHADAHMPGAGTSVKPARATWDTGWFQTEIFVQALEKLGYDVQDPVTLDNPPFYQAVAQGDVDFWVNGWFPLHNSYSGDFKKGAERVGYVAKGGALQGYLVDKKTANDLNVMGLEDFKRDKVKEAFDSDGDGKAELVACPPGWGCEKVIAHQLDAYDLRDHVDPVKASYSASMADALGRYNEGESIFFYTWTPNWTVGMLPPGEDVVWIQTPRPDLPADQKKYEDQTTVSGVKGCVADPCKMGWPANDIRPVANSGFLQNNPAGKALFEEMQVPLQDIFAQNAKMQEGEDKKEDIERHASQWIENHQDMFDGWIETAEQAAM